MIDETSELREDVEEPNVDHLCPKCKRGVLEVVDIVEVNDEEQVVVGCDECRHVQYLSREFANNEGYLL